MKTENIIIAHPQTDEQANVIKAFMKALKIKFELLKESPYNSDFVTKIKKSKKEFENGDFTRVEKSELQNFLGLVE
jgi:transcription antitermination factor NusG